MGTRYVKINSCRSCEYNGHITNSVGWAKFTFICGNPIHDGKIVNIPRERLGGTNYPITGYGNRLEDNQIPEWCMLPKPE